jgi:hypothetical protein
VLFFATALVADLKDRGIFDDDFWLARLLNFMFTLGKKIGL